jgi:hypothetical protein
LLSLVIKTIQFTLYHLLIVVVDRITRLPRSGVQPEVERILRENLALKAHVRALVLELKSARGARPRVSLRTRAGQVFAYLLTRGDKAFQSYYLSTSRRTLAKWATTFRQGPWPWRKPRQTGRPPLSQTIKDLIIRLKNEYRTYYNEHRANQAIGGLTPAAFGRGLPEGDVISLDEVRRRRMVKRKLAHGLLSAYELVEDESVAA